VEFSLKQFRYEVSEAKTKTHFTQNHFEPRDQVSDLLSLYFRRYDLRKLGFLKTIEFHLKQVIMELSLYLFLCEVLGCEIKNRLSRYFGEACTQL